MKTPRPILWLLPAALIYGVLSALCWPSTYTLSHMVIDYHYGFGKRGLIGCLLALIDHPPYHYLTLAWMVFTVLVAWLGCLMLAARRGLRHDVGVASAFIVFFLSAGFASLVDDLGRGEHFGLVLAIPCLFLPVRRGWLPIRAGLLAAAVLAQEINLLFVVPVVAFDVWAGWPQRAGLRAVAAAGAVVLPALALTWYLGNVRTACATDIAVAHFQSMAADFPFQAIPVVTLCLNGAANLKIVFQNLWSVAAEAVAFPLVLCVVLPSTVFNLLLALRTLKEGGFAVAACVVAAFAPIPLIAVGADVTRFVSLIQLSSLLVLVSAIRRRGLPPGGTLPPSPHRVWLVGAVCAFQLGSAVTLTDGTQPLKFPFMPLVKRAVTVWQGTAPFVVIK